MGNGRSRYAGDFPSNASAAALGGEEEERRLPASRAGGENRGGGVKSAGWMIDGELKWNRDLPPSRL